jgi:predicted RND superfamily exporter protein
MRPRALALLGIVIAACALAPGLRDLELDNSFEIWFPEDDPGLRTYQRFQADYGNDEAVVVGVALSDDNALAETQLRPLWELRARIEAIDGIAHVQSLASLPSPESIDRLLADEFIESDQMLAPFVDSHGTAYKLIVWLDRDENIDARRPALLRELRQVAADVFPDNRGVWLAGPGVILDALNDATIRDSALLLPLSYVLILAVIGIATRSIAWVGVAIAAVAFGNLVTFGVMGFAGRPVTMISMALPPLILVITACNTLHLARCYGSRHRVLRPIVFSALTSAAGFSSLAIAEMAVTRDYGIFAALGIVASTLVCLTLASFVGSTAQAGESPSDFGARIFGWASRRRTLVIALASVLVIGCASLARNIVVDTDPLGFLDRDHRTRSDHANLRAAFGPYLPMEFVLTFDDAAVIEEPRTLTRVLALQEAVERLDAVAWSYSYANVSLAEEYLPSYAIADVGPLKWLDDSGRRIRITFLVETGSARDFKVLAQEILAVASLPDGATLQATGYLPMYGRLVDHVIRDQTRSLMLAVMVIFGLIALLFRDIGMLLASAIANLPVVVALGAIMAVLDIPLDVATITVAPALLGLIVDDTIHVLYAVRRGSLVESGGAVGTTLALTTLALVLGFGILGFAGINTIATTGVLMATGVALALSADLVLLPALLSYASSPDPRAGRAAPHRGPPGLASPGAEDTGCARSLPN